jgi:hypothetical protein
MAKEYSKLNKVANYDREAAELIDSEEDSPWQE